MKERSERLEEKETDISSNYAIFVNFEEKKCLTQDEHTFHILLQTRDKINI